MTSAAAGSSYPPPPDNGRAGESASTQLAPGFRFHPTDEELVSYYLKRKVTGRPLRVDAIAEVDLYKLEPWDLPALSRLRSRDVEWYFFSPLDRKGPGRAAARTNRATSAGYWKTTGKDREVRRAGRLVGMKKTLVFHSGRAPRGQRTNWVMHEYRLDGEELTKAQIPLDSYVVCRIFQKSGPGPMNGAQYGAPFVEEEWAEEDGGFMPVEKEDEDTCVDANGFQQQEFLQMDDFLQDLGNRNESGDLNPQDFLVDMVVDIPEMISTNSEEISNGHVSFADVPDAIDEHMGNFPVLNAKMEDGVTIEALSNNAGQVDEFLELEDFTEAVIMDYPVGEDAIVWPPDMWPQEAVNEQENVENVGDVQESGAIDPSGENLLSQEEIEELLQLLQERPNEQQPLHDTRFDSTAPRNDSIEFYDAVDAPVDEFLQLEDFDMDINALSSPVIGHMPVIEETYNMFHDAHDSLQQIEGFNLSYDSRLQEVDSLSSTCIIGSGSVTVSPMASSYTSGALLSAELSASGSPSNDKSDLFAKQDGYKNNLLLKLLESLPAPEANASELPAKVLDSGMPVHVNHEMIQFCSMTVEGNEVDGGNCAIMHCGCSAMLAVLRGSCGFFLLALSVLMLGLTYKVGFCIYTKEGAF